MPNLQISTDGPERERGAAVPALWGEMDGTGMNAQTVAQVTREQVLGKIHKLAEMAKIEAWREVIREHGKSLEALDGIVVVLVNRGVNPDVAARLAMRYWARGWDQRLAEALQHKWHATEEEVQQLKIEIETGAWWQSALDAKNISKTQ